MREADRLTMETYGLPGFTLMETAGRGAAACIEARYGPMPGKKVVVCCGKGNNGGDGLVVARVLYERGATVHVILTGRPEELTDAAARNLVLLQTLLRHDADGRLTIADPEAFVPSAPLPGADLYVDALLGTGLTHTLREPLRTLVNRMNACTGPIVALDLPTGLHTDTGGVLGTAVRADLTLTMGALKKGILLGRGPLHAGHVAVVDIGIPAFVLDRVMRQAGCALRPTDAAIRAWLPERAHDAHKYSAGLALVVAGSPGLTGAPVMAATAAARIGSGYVVCAAPASVQPLLATRFTEVATLALPEDDDGLRPREALDALAPRLDGARALLVGPGLGRQPGTAAFVRTLLAHTDHPVVIDADGLNALAGHTGLLTEHAGGRWILTPHAGEFKRLAGEDVDLTDRVLVAAAYARRWHCVLLLKGMPSVVGCPDGRVFLNATGNPALATAGTGDVLAGLCAGLLARGMPPDRAAVCALHLGGAAADRYVRDQSPHTMVATDLLRQLPHVLHELH